MLKQFVVLFCLATFTQSLAAQHPQHHGGKHHSHEKLEIQAGVPVPQLSLKVMADAKRGWNIQVITQNFRFAPEKVNMANLPGEGHGHLLVNGKKLTRLYSNWYYLENLPPGEHQITVILNSNKHQELSSQGKVISATAAIKVPAQ